MHACLDTTILYPCCASKARTNDSAQVITSVTERDSREYTDEKWKGRPGLRCQAENRGDKACDLRSVPDDRGLNETTAWIFRMDLCGGNADVHSEHRCRWSGEHAHRLYGSGKFLDAGRQRRPRIGRGQSGEGDPLLLR